jgi:hypothetical protein
VPNAPEIFRRLAGAKVKLQNAPANQLQAVPKIKNILDSIQNYIREKLNGETNW